MEKSIRPSLAYRYAVPHDGARVSRAKPEAGEGPGQGSGPCDRGAGRDAHEQRAAGTVAGSRAPDGSIELVDPAGQSFPLLVALLLDGFGFGRGAGGFRTGQRVVPVERRHMLRARRLHARRLLTGLALLIVWVLLVGLGRRICARVRIGFHLRLGARIGLDGRCGGRRGGHGRRCGVGRIGECRKRCDSEDAGDGGE